MPTQRSVNQLVQLINQTIDGVRQIRTEEEFNQIVPYLSLLNQTGLMWDTDIVRSVSSSSSSGSATTTASRRTGSASRSHRATQKVVPMAGRRTA